MADSPVRKPRPKPAATAKPAAKPAEPKAEVVEAEVEQEVEVVVIKAPSCVRKDYGIHLQDIQERDAEIQRAAVEKRMPDFSKFYGDDFLENDPDSEHPELDLDDSEDED